VAERALSKRERQIMDTVFQAGEASAADVHERLPDPPTYTAVRTMMRVLEEKTCCSIAARAASTSTHPANPRWRPGVPR
jgi:predicted transcriptional regulator